MAFVVQGGKLSVTGAGVMPAFAPAMLPPAPWEYATIWRTQPQVRTVIGFLSRNIAQLGIHVFQRTSNVDRQRLTDHPLAQLLGSPLPGITTYRWVERLVADRCLYDEAYGIKLLLNGRLCILPVPPTLIWPVGGTWIAPDHYVTPGGREFGPDEVLHIHGYAPEALTHGSSPIDSLRELLLESSESAKNRAKMWRGGARITGIISRPADAPDWGPDDKRRFRAMWRSFADGGGAEGGTPILEDGMTYIQAAFSPEQAQYIEARKLTREECAAAYYIPPPLIGILDHATYSNIREQHKHLYQDTLGPWLVEVEQEIAAQILPDLPGDNTDVYAEFNIQGKMRGSFEEQADAASTAIGGPWMTRAEMRARFNLPELPGTDQLIVPMNVTEGGLASPRDTAPDSSASAAPKARRLPRTKAEGDGRPADLGTLAAERTALEKALGSATQRAGDKLLTSAGAKDGGDGGEMPDLLALWDAGADDRVAQLQALLAHHGFRLAQVGAWEVLAEWNPDADGWAADVMLAWITAAAETYAAQHESAGRTAVAAVQASGGDGWAGGLADAMAGWVSAAGRRAVTVATETRSFGGHDAAHASGLETKTWRTGGTNPRPSHAALNGDTVPLDDLFGNGLRWPGDGEGDAAETAHCNCHLTYAKG
jgi:HK97 family phage portal protein